MPNKKKFSGRKMKAGEVYIHISSKYDEFRELYNKDDSVLAQYLNKHINNELQTKILSYLNEEHIKPFVENNSYNEINTTFDDDFIIDEYEKIEENIITNEKRLEKISYYELIQCDTMYDYFNNKMRSKI